MRLYSSWRGNLSSFSLVGALPDFSSMDALVTIDLHDNGLEGPIPEFLGSFPYLKQLVLSNNRFNGTIPTSLSKNKNLKLAVTGNCLTGMSCPPPPPPQVTPPAETPPAETLPDSPPDYQVPSAPNPCRQDHAHHHRMNSISISHLLPPTIRLRSCFYY
ncbi:hypothetical protein ACLB2K_070782 [Fragaria x ananassa]